MQHAADLLTRWPALEVAAKRDRLRRGLRALAGPIANRVRADTASGRNAQPPPCGAASRRPGALSARGAGDDRQPARLADVAALMADSLDRLRAFADGVKRDGFTDVVLLGMGGSSLAPEVLRAIVGTAPGWPRFHMLDSTDPAAIRAAATTPRQTLYLLASKSGTTIEPNTLAAHFRRMLEDAGIARWADHFVAITDDGTELARRARAESFRDTFINPSDIGGRYSALSFFGLVPAALMGQDIAALTGWALAMLSARRRAGGRQSGGRRSACSSARPRAKAATS